MTVVRRILVAKDAIDWERRLSARLIGLRIADARSITRDGPAGGFRLPESGGRLRLALRPEPALGGLAS